MFIAPTPGSHRSSDLENLGACLAGWFSRFASALHQSRRASHHGRECLRQFRDHVQPLFQLRVRLGQLSKQDMDNEALDFSVIARQLVHHVNPPEILRAIHLVGHVIMCHDKELYSSVLIMREIIILSAVAGGFHDEAVNLTPFRWR